MSSDPLLNPDGHPKSARNNHGYEESQQILISPLSGIFTTLSQVTHEAAKATTISDEDCLVFVRDQMAKYHAAFPPTPKHHTNLEKKESVVPGWSKSTLELATSILQGSLTPHDLLVLCTCAGYTHADIDLDEDAPVHDITLTEFSHLPPLQKPFPPPPYAPPALRNAPIVDLSPLLGTPDINRLVTPTGSTSGDAILKGLSTQLRSLVELAPFDIKIIPERDILLSNGSIDNPRISSSAASYVAHSTTAEDSNRSSAVGVGVSSIRRVPAAIAVDPVGYAAKHPGAATSVPELSLLAHVPVHADHVQRQLYAGYLRSPDLHAFSQIHNPSGGRGGKAALGPGEVSSGTRQAQMLISAGADMTPSTGTGERTTSRMNGGEVSGNNTMYSEDSLYSQQTPYTEDPLYSEDRTSGHTATSANSEAHPSTDTNNSTTASILTSTSGSAAGTVPERPIRARIGITKRMNTSTSARKISGAGSHSQDNTSMGSHGNVDIGTGSARVHPQPPEAERSAGATIDMNRAGRVVARSSTTTANMTNTMSNGKTPFGKSGSLSRLGTSAGTRTSKGTAMRGTSSVGSIPSVVSSAPVLGTPLYSNTQRALLRKLSEDLLRTHRLSRTQAGQLEVLLGALSTVMHQFVRTLRHVMLLQSTGGVGSGASGGSGGVEAGASGGVAVSEEYGSGGGKNDLIPESGDPFFSRGEDMWIEVIKRDLGTGHSRAITAGSGRNSGKPVFPENALQIPKSKYDRWLWAHGAEDVLMSVDDDNSDNCLQEDVVQAVVTTNDHDNLSKETFLGEEGKEQEPYLESTCIDTDDAVSGNSENVSEKDQSSGLATGLTTGLEDHVSAVWVAFVRILELCGSTRKGQRLDIGIGTGAGIGVGIPDDTLSVDEDGMVGENPENANSEEKESFSGTHSFLGDLDPPHLTAAMASQYCARPQICEIVDNYEELVDRLQNRYTEYDNVHTEQEKTLKQWLQDVIRVENGLQSTQSEVSLLLVQYEVHISAQLAKASAILHDIGKYHAETRDFRNQVTVAYSRVHMLMADYRSQVYRMKRVQKRILELRQKRMEIVHANTGPISTRVSILRQTVLELQKRKKKLIHNVETQRTHTERWRVVAARWLLRLQSLQISNGFLASLVNGKIRDKMMLRVVLYVLKAESSELAKEDERLETNLTILEGKVEEARDKLDRARADVQFAKKKLEASRVTSEEALQELDQVKVELEHRRDLVTALKNRLIIEENTLKNAESCRDEVFRKSDEATATLLHLRSEATKLRESLEEALGDVVAANEELKTARKELEEEQKTCDDLIGVQQETKKDTDDIMVTYQSQLTALMAKAQEIEQRTATIQSQVDALQQKAEAASASNKTTAERIQTLTMELSRVDAAIVQAQEDAAMFQQQRHQRHNESIRLGEERRRVENAIPRSAEENSALEEQQKKELATLESQLSVLEGTLGQWRQAECEVDAELAREEAQGKAVEDTYNTTMAAFEAEDMRLRLRLEKWQAKQAVLAAQHTANSQVSTRVAAAQAQLRQRHEINSFLRNVAERWARDKPRALQLLASICRDIDVAARDTRTAVRLLHAVQFQQHALAHGTRVHWRRTLATARALASLHQWTAQLQDATHYPHHRANAATRDVTVTKAHASEGEGVAEPVEAHVAGRGRYIACVCNDYVGNHVGEEIMVVCVDANGCAVQTVDVPITQRSLDSDDDPTKPKSAYNDAIDDQEEFGTGICVTNPLCSGETPLCSVYPLDPPLEGEEGVAPVSGKKQARFSDSEILAQESTLSGKSSLSEVSPSSPYYYCGSTLIAVDAYQSAQLHPSIAPFVDRRGWLDACGTVLGHALLIEHVRLLVCTWATNVFTSQLSVKKTFISENSARGNIFSGNSVGSGANPSNVLSESRKSTYVLHRAVRGPQGRLFPRSLYAPLSQYEVDSVLGPVKPLHSVLGSSEALYSDERTLRARRGDKKLLTSLASDQVFLSTLANACEREPYWQHCCSLAMSADSATAGATSDEAKSSHVREKDKQVEVNTDRDAREAKGTDLDLDIGGATAVSANGGISAAADACVDADGLPMEFSASMDSATNIVGDGSSGAMDASLAGNISTSGCSTTSCSFTVPWEVLLLVDAVLARHRSMCVRAVQAAFAYTVAANQCLCRKYTEEEEAQEDNEDAGDNAYTGEMDAPYSADDKETKGDKTQKKSHDIDVEVKEGGAKDTVGEEYQEEENEGKNEKNENKTSTEESQEGGESVLQPKEDSRERISGRDVTDGQNCRRDDDNSDISDGEDEDDVSLVDDNDDECMYMLSEDEDDEDDDNNDKYTSTIVVTTVDIARLLLAQHNSDDSVSPRSPKSPNTAIKTCAPNTPSNTKKNLATTTIVTSAPGVDLVALQQHCQYSHCTIPAHKRGRVETLRAIVDGAVITRLVAVQLHVAGDRTELVRVRITGIPKHACGCDVTLALSPCSIPFSPVLLAQHYAQVHAEALLPVAKEHGEVSVDFHVLHELYWASLSPIQQSCLLIAHLRRIAIKHRQRLSMFEQGIPMFSPPIYDQDLTHSRVVKRTAEAAVQTEYVYADFTVQTPVWLMFNFDAAEVERAQRHEELTTKSRAQQIL